MHRQSSAIDQLAGKPNSIHLSLGWRQLPCKRLLTMVTMVDWWWWVSIPSSPTLFPTTIQSNSIVRPVRPLSTQPTAQLRHLMHLRYKSLSKPQPSKQQQQQHLLQPLPRPKLKAHSTFTPYHAFALQICTKTTTIKTTTTTNLKLCFAEFWLNRFGIKCTYFPNFHRRPIVTLLEKHSRAKSKQNSWLLLTLDFVVVFGRNLR